MACHALPNTVGCGKLEQLLGEGNMRHLFFAVSVLSLVSGCAQPPKLEPKWRAEPNFDAFSDEDTCRVTTWFAHGDAPGERLANRLYPLVEKRGNSVSVGVMTAPMHVGSNLYAGPTGDVQLKIDSNPTWTIAAVETPPEVRAGTSAATMDQKARERVQAAIKSSPFADEKMAAALEKAVAGNDMMASVRAMTSPRTLATGDKAAQILAQMKQGGSLMYRKLGASGAATSEPNTFPLAGFNEAAAQCGL